MWFFYCFLITGKILNHDGKYFGISTLFGVYDGKGPKIVSAIRYNSLCRKIGCAPGRLKIETPGFSVNI